MAITHCPACRCSKNYELYRWEKIPLGVLSLPKSEKQARKMPRYPIDLRRCAACGHIYHCDFDEKNLKYEQGTTLVFNQGTAWVKHQDSLAEHWIKLHGLRGKKIVELGCGEGDFLSRLQKAGCDCVGFEPGKDALAARKKGLTVERKEFGIAALAKLRPDAILCRHVLEHLVCPADFLQEIAINCQALSLQPVFLAEVPRIEKALEQTRISDFFYEHISHFTEQSFRTLFEGAGYEVLALEEKYGGEVFVLSAKPKPGIAGDLKLASEQFAKSVAREVQGAKKQIQVWKKGKAKIALWGAAGKAAAFINMLGLTKENFPIVVDSDPKKAGKFVPGTGQEIRPPSYLNKHPVDGIWICTNWRARDIEREI